MKQIESKHKESQEKLLKLANNAEAAQEGPVMAREERSPSATKVNEMQIIVLPRPEDNERANGMMAWAQYWFPR